MTDIYEIDREEINGLKGGIKSETSNKITESDARYDAQIADTEKWGTDAKAEVDKATEESIAAQNQMTEHNINVIEQNKAQAEEDYQKEQSAAYVDWQKQSNAHGIDAEIKAMNGMTNTGYSESSKVAMYNQYQNRVAIAREAIVKTRTDYDNQISYAKAQNSLVLAQIYSQAAQQKLEIGFKVLTTTQGLFTQKAEAAERIDSAGESKWQNELDNYYREKEYNLGIDKYEKETTAANKNALISQILTTGNIGTAEDWKAAGMTESEVNSYLETYKKNKERDDAEWQYQVDAYERDKTNESYTKLENSILLTGKIPNADELKAAGMTEAEAQALVELHNENDSAKVREAKMSVLEMVATGVPVSDADLKAANMTKDDLAEMKNTLGIVDGYTDGGDVITFENGTKLDKASVRMLTELYGTELTEETIQLLVSQGAIKFVDKNGVVAIQVVDSNIVKMYGSNNPNSIYFYGPMPR